MKTAFVFSFLMIRSFFTLFHSPSRSLCVPPSQSHLDPILAIMCVRWSFIQSNDIYWIGQDRNADSNWLLNGLKAKDMYTCFSDIISFGSQWMGSEWKFSLTLTLSHSRRPTVVIAIRSELKISNLFIWFVTRDGIACNRIWILNIFRIFHSVFVSVVWLFVLLLFHLLLLLFSFFLLFA